MYESTALDRFLAFHAPRLIGFNPKDSSKAVRRGIALFIGIVVGIAGVKMIGLLSGAAFWLILFLVIGIAVLRGANQKAQTPKSFLQSLYHQVYGRYGWNEDAGPHRSTEPVPIRASAKVLSPEAFELLDSAATQALRIYGSSSNSNFARQASTVVDEVMKGLFRTAEGLLGGGVVPADAVRDLQQLTELADHVAGIRDPKPALTQGGISPLEALLLDARAEHRARQELELGLTSEAAQQQQQQ